MNKKLLFLLTVSLGLVSCKTSNNTSSSNSQSSSSSESTSSSSSSSSSQLPNVDAPKTVTDIYNLIKNTSLKMEITYGRSAERNYVIGQAHLFDDSYETSKEVYHSYSDDVVTVSGEVKYERIPNDEWGEEVLENDTFEGISALVDNYFYHVLDYSNENIHEDSANRYSVPAEVNEQMVDAYTTNGLSLMLINHFDNYILDNIVQEADKIDPVIDANGDFSYEYQLAYNTPMEYEILSTVINLEVSFTSYGMIKSYYFSVKENSVSEDWEGNTVTKFYESVEDTFTCTDFGKKEAHTSFNINPLDYYLVSYDIQLFEDDLMGMEDSLTPVEANKIPLDANLVAKVINPQPVSALDTELDIIESSNPDVVKVTTYDEYDSTVKAVGLGNATLTVVSESGIEKTIDVTVITKPLESLEISIYDSSIVEGDVVSVYVTRYPESNIDELEATLSCSSDIATVTKDEDGDFVINALKPAENVVLTISSKVNPSIKGEYTFTIYKKYSFDEIKENIKDSVWVSKFQESSATIAFNADGTGYFMVTNNTSYGSVFIENQKYTFTYTIEEHSDGYPGDVTITLSDFTVTTSGGSNYNFNNNIVVLDYSMSCLDVKLTPEGESGWMFTFDDDFYLNQK